MATSYRIASYYGDIATCGRNDGGPLYHAECLRKLFGKDNMTHIFPAGDLDRLGKFDLHWMTDWGEDALGYEKFELPHPFVYITSDTHLGYDYRLSRAKRADWIFCNQLRAVDEFVRDGIPSDRCFWLPHAFDPLAYSPGIFNLKKNDWDTEAVPMKKYDVCFIGNLNDENRVLHLDRLFKEFPSFHWGNQRFHEAAERFNQSKIVFNVAARDDANMRLWEALGSRSFLLTNRIPTLDELFTDGVHLVTYRNHDEMIDKARYYLAHDEERDKIAQAGYEWVTQTGTYMHRVLEVLKRIGISDELVTGLSGFPLDAWRIGAHEEKNGLPQMPSVPILASGGV